MPASDSPPILADMEPCILALDQGTTSSRAIVFDRAGRALAVSQKPFTQSYPRPGWVEHDPLEIWATQLAAAREAIAQARIEPVAASPASASPTSGRRRCSGTGTRGSRCVPPSCGRTVARRTSASTLSARGPGAASSRTARGSSRSVLFGDEDHVGAGEHPRAARRRRTRETCASARWTRGCCAS